MILVLLHVIILLKLFAALQITSAVGPEGVTQPVLWHTIISTIREPHKKNKVLVHVGHWSLNFDR